MSNPELCGAAGPRMWPAFFFSQHFHAQLRTEATPGTFKCHKPWYGTEISSSFALILSREPHLQQLLSPLEEMCTVIFHHETTDTQKKILIVGCNVNSFNKSSLGLI